VLIPPLPAALPLVPPPPAAGAGKRYRVVVNHVPLRDVLFALARDAALNLDLRGELSDPVTVHVVDETVPQILARLGRQFALRYTLEGDRLTVAPDEPYFHTYEVDYVNLARDTETSVSVATQVATTGEGGAEQAAGSGGGAGSNSSSTGEVHFGSHGMNALMTLSTNGDPETSASCKPFPSFSSGCNDGAELLQPTGHSGAAKSEQISEQNLLRKKGQKGQQQRRHRHAQHVAEVGTSGHEHVFEGVGKGATALADARQQHSQVGIQQHDVRRLAGHIHRPLHR
jgi:hypothetical protein